MVAKKKCGCGKKRRQRGRALKQSGNGFISDLLGNIPIVGPMAGMPFKMIGLGKGRRVQRGGGPWGDILNNLVHQAGNQAINDLGNLTRRL